MMITGQALVFLQYEWLPSDHHAACYHARIDLAHCQGQHSECVSFASPLV